MEERERVSEPLSVSSSRAVKRHALHFNLLSFWHWIFEAQLPSKFLACAVCIIFILSVCADNGWIDVGKIHWHVLKMNGLVIRPSFFILTVTIGSTERPAIEELQGTMHVSL